MGSGISYLVCVAGTTVLGIGVGATGGAIVGGPLAPAAATLGGIVGFGIGIAKCDVIAPAVKKKLFEMLKLNEQEVEALLTSINKMYPFVDRNRAIEMLATLRLEVAQNPWQYRNV